jgi:hypothetical protein
MLCQRVSSAIVNQKVHLNDSDKYDTDSLGVGNLSTAEDSAFFQFCPNPEMALPRGNLPTQ